MHQSYLHTVHPAGGKENGVNDVDICICVVSMRRDSQYLGAGMVLRAHGSHADRQTLLPFYHFPSLNVDGIKDVYQ